MKVNKSAFLKALQLVSKAVNPKPIIPLLANILIEVEGNSMRLSGTNYELGIRTNITVDEGIEGKESFTTAIPAKLSTDLVNVIQSEQIDLSYDSISQQLLFKTDTSKNKVHCMNADDFPDVPGMEGEGITINSTMFKEAIERVSYAASPGEGILGGVLITVDKGKLILFATDGFHLSYEEIPLDKKYKKVVLRAIVRSSMIETISRMIEDGADLEIATPGTQIRFRCNSTEINSQKLDGQFPDYNMLKAGEPNTSISIPTLLLLRS